MVALITSRRRLLRNVAALGLGAATGIRALTAFAEGARAQAGRASADYRALICISLTGGADSYNLLLPWDDPSWADYAHARTALALPRAMAVPLAGSHQGGRAFAVHRGLEALAPIFARGDLAFVANVGTLEEPTTPRAWRAGTARVPFKQIDHDVQKYHWQTGLDGGGFPGVGVPEPSPPPLGVLGRMLDGYPEVPPADLPRSATVGVETRILRGTSGDGLLFDIPVMPEQITRATAGIPEVADEFPAYYLAQQLRTIARLIAAGRAAGLRRQAFHVSIGTWDFHKGGVEPHNRIAKFFGESLAGLHRGLAALGLADVVTTFTISEFARQLQFNGDGADHAWGGVLMVMGGSVDGGRIIGEYPELVIGGTRDVGLGSFIPVISVEEYYADLALWFGVAASDLPRVLPNIGRFIRTDRPSPPLGLMKATV